MDLSACRRTASFRLVLFDLIVAFHVLAFVFHPVNCQQQQYFRVRPQASVEVVEGGTIVLHCVVGSQAGQVQWSRNGFLLGFTRSIPGFPRYSMSGNALEGTHNLQIEDARLDDDGEYQCQVSPGGGSKGIRAMSKLTVLLRPTSIEIVGHSNGTNVEIKQEENLRLECVVSGGKPAAQIKWFRKNVELKSDHAEVQSSEVTNSNGEAGLEVTISKSSINLRPRSDDNGVSYTCEAHHPALEVPMRHSVFLSVLFPPGPPEISGYEEGETARMGDTMTLVCRSRGGNPLAQLVWFKNNEQVDFSYTTTTGRESQNSHTFIVDASDNNAVYRCEASSQLISPSPVIASVKLTVHFAPAKVTITGPSEAKAGDNVTMVCSTARSNPPAQISWVVDGRPMIADNTVTADPTGGFITTASVTVSVTNQDRSKKSFACYAVNEALGENVVETSHLSILYPPDSPSIFGYQESSSIRAGTLQRLTCVVHGGNPLPDLKWYTGEEEVKAGATPSINGNVVSNELALVTKDSDNGATYRCEASSAATGDKPLIASIKLTVHFPPSGVTIKMKPKRPKAGSKVDLICETSGSNPVSVISWWRDGFQITGNQDGIFDASFGGKSTRNILPLNVTSEDDGAVYTCQATNTLLQQSVHDATTLNVLYKPEFVNSPLTRFELAESESMSINLTARGNPSLVEYKWSRADGKEMDTVRFVADGPLLNVSSAVRSDSATYKIEATNEQGTSETTIILNVHYPASIKKITDLVLADQGKNAYLECQVDANPITKDMITWRRRRNSSSTAWEEIEAAISGDILLDDATDSEMRTRQTNEQNRSFLIIYNVSREDSGAFDCIASNGIGEKDSRTANLVVKHKPIIDRSPILSKSAVDNGETGRLYCRAEGAPNVTFTWTREGSVISSRRGDAVDDEAAKYLIEQTEQLDLITFQSVLLIKRVSSADYGAYKCIARNELGHDTIGVNFTRTSKPDTPLALRVINITASTVTLKWIPGFDGGMVQSFQVRFNRVGENEPSLYTDVYPSNTTQYTISQLASETEYNFSVMAYNSLGPSLYTADIVKAVTFKESPVSETEKVISQVLSGKAGDIPRLIIIVVSVAGASLLLLNLVLVICFVRKRRKKRSEEESDQSSTSKGAGTIEMYAPASGSGGSYNNGVIETSLSGTSDEENKSDRASSPYSGHTDYLMEISPSGVVTHHHHGISTYLIDDNIRPIPNYPTRFTNNLTDLQIIWPTDVHKQNFEMPPSFIC